MTEARAEAPRLQAFMQHGGYIEAEPIGEEDADIFLVVGPHDELARYSLRAADERLEVASR
jgi:hypothetical protein